LSEQSDSKFIDSFMVVLGILVLIAVAIYFLAASMATRTEFADLRDDPRFAQRVEERIAPIGQVAIAGQDNVGIRDPGGVAPPQMEAPPREAMALLEPRDVYMSACTACHGPGIAGAPRTGDAAAWAPRLEQGMDTLVTHAIEGFQGEAGYMPPRGGHPNLTDEQVRDAVQFMVDEIGN
jgi:cytochrome c5